MSAGSTYSDPLTPDQFFVCKQNKPEIVLVGMWYLLEPRLRRDPGIFVAATTDSVFDNPGLSLPQWAFND